MSDLNSRFFAHLAQKLPGFKKQFAGAKTKSKLKQNGILEDGVPCGICGKKFSVKTKIILKTEAPIQYCDDCQALLNAGQAAFVTVEKKPRYWIGAGAHPNLCGKVTVISSAQMDAIERAMATLPQKPTEPQSAHIPFQRAGVKCKHCNSENVMLWHPFNRKWIGAACKDCGKQFNLNSNGEGYYTEPTDGATPANN